uniref:Uncharacterized protein n=1 Tax=Oryza glumipatula TaxID=40148 RepID=A0A0D9ZWD7_9ORYZ
MVREGELAGIVEDMRLDPFQPTSLGPRRRYGVCWHGALYVIKMPANFEKNDTQGKPYIGKSKKGFHEARLRVWILSESCEHTEWILTCDLDLNPYHKHLFLQNLGIQNGPWILERDSSDSYGLDPEILRKKESSGWDSENEDFFTVDDEDGEEYGGYFYILGFHPYKKVVFVAESSNVLAYHLDSSKVQYLGTHILGVTFAVHTRDSRTHRP